MPLVNVEFQEVTADTPPLVDRGGKYKAMHDRIKALNPGGAFRAKFQGKHTAKNARTSAIQFADREGIVITTSVLDEVLEVTRLEKRKEVVR